MRPILRLIGMVWASPYSLLGLAIGATSLAAGGTARVRGRTVEFSGRLISWMFSRLPTGEFTLAMTLGHTILGKTEAALDIAREHELVHVEQYERWGLFMGPAYLLSSLYLWCTGRRPYDDNPFEREAYGRSGELRDRRS